MQYGDAAAPECSVRCVVELTHLATLYHDRDVMDEAPRRRGAESANLRWGNTGRDPDRRDFARARRTFSPTRPEAV